MKKALVALLLLAVAGGLFAQDEEPVPVPVWSISGVANAGIGWMKLTDQDDNIFGLIGHTAETDGARAQVNIRGINADGTAGLRFAIRATSSFGVGSLQFRHAFGWLKAFDGMLEVQTGRIQGTNFDMFGPIEDGMGTFYDGYGVLTYINPIPGFSFGVGARTGQVLSGGANVDKVTGWLGFGASIADLLDLNAQFTGNQATKNAFVSASIGALPGIGINATAIFLDLLNFSDSGQMWFHEHVGIDLIENLSLNIAASQGMFSEDGPDMYFRGWAWLTYGLGDIVPRLDVNYIMAGTFNPAAGLGFNYSYCDSETDLGFATGNKDHAFLTVSPSITCKVAGGTWVELGYMLLMDMSTNDAVAVGIKNGAVNHAAFIDVRVTF
jgi:hypothetical protein